MTSDLNLARESQGRLGKGFVATDLHRVLVLPEQVRVGPCHSFQSRAAPSLVVQAATCSKGLAPSSGESPKCKNK